MHRALFAVAALAFALALARDRAEDWITATVLPPIAQTASVEIVDRTGKLMHVFAVETGRVRMQTRPVDVDPAYLDLLIRVEDKRFWTHNGVDPVAMARAAGQALWHGRVVSGASTLTMQTARLLENSGTGAVLGKLRQIRVALALERRLSKSEILALYLTHAPFGGPIEGVRAASYAWFGKPPARLSQEEAALLVALPQAPSQRRPDRYADAARLARDRILARHGDTPARERVPEALHPFPSLAPHLAEQARAAYAADSPVQVTLDSDVQSAMARLARQATEGLPQAVSAAILVADHRRGEILAYVGASHYGDPRRDGFVDMVQAVRSPGSTLKPLIYALAFDQGFAHPGTFIHDGPVSFGSYDPQNFDGAFRGDVTIRTALQLSLNIPPVLLTDALGPARVVAGLRRAGLSPRLPDAPPGLAVALGGVGLTLEELVQLYAGLAQNGRRISLGWSFPAEPRQDRFLSAASAWHVGHILADIQPPGGQPKGHIAFKTGTSYGHRDAWAIGWDGAHVIGIWLGRPDGTPVPGIFGGDIAAPVLFEAFDRVATERTPLPPPPGSTGMVHSADLPRHLQRFGPGKSAHSAPVEIAFPPDGARLHRALAQGVRLKISGGTPPFAVLANASPVMVNLRQMAADVPGLERGFNRLQVVDAIGQADTVEIYLD